MNSQKKHDMDESLNTDTETTQLNAEQQDNSNCSKLDKKWEGKLEVFTENDEQDIYYVINTPFGIYRRDNQYIVMCGKYMVNQKTLNTIEEAYEDAISITWDKIVMVVGILKRHEEELNGGLAN